MIEFKKHGKSINGKNNIYLVKSNGIELGRVAFFGRWSKYCFYPEINTNFDEDYLIEIANFCEKQTNLIFKR